MPKISIRGPIIRDSEKWIYDWFGMDAFCFKDLTKVLDTLNGEPVDVEVASGGGDVFIGSDIYTALKNYRGHVTIDITSLAASAASVIAMAGDDIRIAPTAQIMIHNVSTWGGGDHRDFRHQADVLENYNKSIANAYRLKTNLPEEELLDMMNQETWLTAQEALKKGFANRIMFDEGSRLVASTLNAGLLPLEIINKMQTSGQNPQSRKLQAQYDLLKMKGELHV